MNDSEKIIKGIIEDEKKLGEANTLVERVAKRSGLTNKQAANYVNRYFGGSGWSFPYRNDAR